MSAQLRARLPHQEAALLYCHTATPAVALFMEMRLGKTKVVIDWLRPLSEGKILVVAPLTALRRAWGDELLSEGESAPAFLLGSKAERLGALAQRRKWNLVNFEGLLACPELLSNYRWAAVIVDESVGIRNPSAKVTRLLNKYRENADRRCILSGCPAPESPLDYFEQFNFLHGGFLGFRNFWSFRNAAFFCPPGTYHWFPRPAFKERIRAYVQKHAFVLSRKDAGLGNKKIYETRLVAMEPRQRKMMEKLEAEFMLELPGGEVKTTVWAPVKATWMARLAGGYLDGKTWFEGKFKETVSLLRGELKGEPVVVWFRFNEELFHMEQVLKAAKISATTLYGGVKDTERAERIGSFQKGGVQILLVQLALKLHGQNFARSSTNIFFSNLYSSEIRQQSEDRIEHILKKEPLLNLDLVAEGTCDEDAVRALRIKKKQSDYYLLRDIAEGIKRRVHERTSGNRPRPSLAGLGVLEGEAARKRPLRVRVIKRESR